MSERSPRPHDDDDAPQRRRRPRRRPSTQRPEDDDIQSEKTRPTPDASRRRPKRRPTDEASSSRPAPEGSNRPKKRRPSSQGDQANRSRSGPRKSDRSRNPAQASSGQQRRSKPRPNQEQPQQRRSQSSRDRASASGANESRVPRSSKRKSRSREEASNRSGAAANASGTHSSRRSGGGSGRARGGRRGAKKSGSNKFLIIGIIGFVVLAGGAIGGVAVWKVMNPTPQPADPTDDGPGTAVTPPKDAFIVSNYKIGDRSASEVLAELKDDDEEKAALAAQARDTIAAEIEKEPRLADTVSDYIYVGITSETLADRLKTLKTVMNAPLRVRTKSDHLSRFVFELEGELTMDENTKSELATLVPKVDTEPNTYLAMLNDSGTEHSLKVLIVEYLVAEKGTNPAVGKFFKDYQEAVNKIDESERDPKSLELIEIMKKISSAPANPG